MKRSLATIQRDLSANLKELRVTKGLSQEDLALTADVDRTYVSQIERGVGNPSIRVVSALASSLGVDIGDLLKQRR